MQNREQFVKQWYPLMTNITQGTGIFPQVMMAQAIVETSKLIGSYYYPGESILSKKYNNYFGIKSGGNWLGPVINLLTGEYTAAGQPYSINDNFRVYNSPVDSFKDYINFLKTNPRYTSVGVFNAKNPQEQTTLLQSAGYATNPGYATLLNNIMDSFKSYIVDGNGGNVALIILAIATMFFISNNN